MAVSVFSLLGVSNYFFFFLITMAAITATTTITATTMTAGFILISPFFAYWQMQNKFSLRTLFLLNYGANAYCGNSGKRNNNNGRTHTFSSFLKIMFSLCYIVQAKLRFLSAAISCYITTRSPFRKPRISPHICFQLTAPLWFFSFQKLRGRQNTEQSTR